jgi:serine-type D-Ala-D-Ala carboxypeptidase/endopeptidase
MKTYILQFLLFVPLLQIALPCAQVPDIPLPAVKPTVEDVRTSISGPSWHEVEDNHVVKPPDYELLDAETATPAVPAVSILPPRIIAAAQERVNAKWYPTVVVAFVDGEKSEIATFGKLDDSTVPDNRTVYEIGSITKTFTATLLAEAIQSSKVKLDTPVAALLSGFTVPERNGKQITLASLATQSSGLPYMPDNLAAADPGNPFAGFDEAKLKAFLAGYKLKRDPDEVYEYSNLGFGLLGFALSQPKSYGAAVQAKIFRPLGMTMSAVGLDGAMKAHLATGHNRRNQEVQNWKFDVLAGCGAIDSTAEDMLRYLKANMSADNTTLSAAFRLAQQPRRDMDKVNRIGLAWMTREAQPQDVVWHNGTTFGYASFIGFTADRKRGIVILTNVAESVDDLGFAALSDVSLRSYKTVPLEEATLKNYFGAYKISSGGLVKIFAKGGQLYAQALGEDPIPLFPQSPDEFFTRIDGFHLIFNRQADGSISDLILRQNGDRVAAKLSGEEARSALSKF